MPPALAIGALAAGTIYSANKASSAAKEQSAIAKQGLNLASIPKSTQYGSFVDPGTGTSFIDPSIRAMREQSLANIPYYKSILNPAFTGAMSGLGQIRGRLDELYGQTNDNAFLDPILQRLALQRGQLSRGLRDRGLGGSSFMANALGNFESAAAPGIAQAKQQGIQAQQNILEQLGNLDVQSLSTAGQGVSRLQNLDNVYASIAGANLEQELRALGLESANIEGMLEASRQIGEAGQLRADASGRLLYGAGQFLPLLKELGSGMTPYNPSAGQYGGII